MRDCKHTSVCRYTPPGQPPALILDPVAEAKLRESLKTIDRSQVIYGGTGPFPDMGMPFYVSVHTVDFEPLPTHPPLGRWARFLDRFRMHVRRYWYNARHPRAVYRRKRKIRKRMPEAKR